MVANFGSNDVTLIRIPNPMPRIEEVSPATFPTDGSTFTITITGTGFLPTSVVTLNGQTLPTTYVSATELKAEVSGELLEELLQVSSTVTSIAEVRLGQVSLPTYTIGVTNPGPGGGSSDGDAGITDITPEYKRPTLRSITPDEIESDADELLLTLNGSNFFGGSIVNFRGEGHSPFDSSANRLRVLIPGTDLDPGVYAVSVTNPGAGTSRELGFEVTEEANPVPVITGLEPPSVEAGSAGFVLLLEGHGFIPATRVTLGGTGLNARITPETVEVDVAAGQVAEAGTLSGLVTNEGPGGGSAAFSLSVTTVPAAITSFSPTVVSAGTDVELRVFGSGFTALSVVLVADTRVATEFVGAGELIGRIPAVVLPESGEVPVEVLNLGPGGNRAAGGLLTIEVPVPVLTVLEPVLLALGDLPARIRVLGAGFLRSALIQVDGIDVATAYAGPGELGFTLARVDVAGVIEVTVTNPGPIVSIGLPLTIGSPVPVLREIVPGELVQDALPARVRVLGDGFGPTSVVLLDGVAVADVGLDLTSALQLGGARVSRVFVDGGTLEFEVPAGTAPGEHTVQVETPAPGGGTSGAAILTILNPVPVVRLVSPEATFVGMPVEVEVTGSGFMPESVIFLGGIPVGTRYLGETTLFGTLAADVVGTFGLTVFTPEPGGGESNAVDFTVLPIPNPDPFIEEVDPDEIVEDHETEIEIRGGNFIEGSRVELDGEELRVTGGTSRQLRVTLPPLARGTHELTVINDAPGGGRDTIRFEVKAAPAEVGDAFFKLVRDPTLIVDGDEEIIALSLSEPLDYDLEITATIANSAIAAIVDDDGSNVTSVTETIRAGQVHGAGPLKGVSVGTTTLTVTADGFAPVTATIRVMPADDEGIIDGVSPASIIVPEGGSASFTVTRFDDSQGAPIAIGTSTAPTDKAGVDAGLKFGANSLTVSGTVKGLEAGSSTLKVAGVDAPSLLTDHVINFLPLGVDLPPTVNLQTSGKSVDFDGVVDDAFELVSLPFTFPFFDRDDDDVYVGINGYLTFGAGDSTFAWTDPDDFLDRPRIAAFATDLYLFGASSVFTNEITMAGGDAFVVTYEDMGVFLDATAGGIHTFQIVLFETGAIQFRYGDINNAPSDTEKDVWVGVSPQPPKYDEPFAVWGDGKYLYVADSENDAIRRVSLETREVTTFAGGTTGDLDGFGTAAKFDEPRGITGDGTYLYVADRANHLIRKIDIATREVSTIAGDGSEDDDDGIGSEASFFRPRDLEIVGGDLYVTDRDNHTIRKIELTSPYNVTTFAGSAGVSGSDDGFGTAAEFYRPRGIWSDGTYLYVTDDHNHTIRRIEIATAEVTTWAGVAGSSDLTDGIGAAARFRRPAGIDGDATYIYVTERENHTVRRIEIANAEVTTVAGGFGFADGVGTAAKFRYPTGVWLHGNELYIGDQNNELIRRLDVTTGAVESFSGTQQRAGLVNGVGALTDVADETPFNSNYSLPDGFIYDKFNPISDKLISVSITVTGTPTLTSIVPIQGNQGDTEAVTLTGTNFVPGGTNVAVSGAGVTVSGVSVSGTTSLTATFTIASGAAIGDRDVTVTTLAGTSGPVTFTVNNAPGPAPVLTGLSPDNGTQGSMIEVVLTGSDFSGTSVDLSGVGVTVSSFTVDSATQITAQLVLAGTAGARTVAVTTANGTSNTLPLTINASLLISESTLEVSGFVGSDGAGFGDGRGPDARFNTPRGVFADGSYLYVADSSNLVIRKVNIATGRVTTLAGSPGQSGKTDGTGSAARFTSPWALWGDGTNLYVVDRGANSIRKIVISSGVVTTFAGSTTGVSGNTNATGTAARFNFPSGIWGDGTNLYVAEFSNHLIRKITLAGAVVTTFAGTSGTSGSNDDTGVAATFAAPDSITGDGTNLYVTGINHTIRQIVITSQVVTTLAGFTGLTGSTDDTADDARFFNPEGMWSDGTDLYVADRSNRTVRKVVIASGVVTTFVGTAGVNGTDDGTGAAAQFATPFDLSGDGTNLYLVEGSNHQVRKIVIASGVVTTLAGNYRRNGDSTDDSGAVAQFNQPEGVWADGLGNLFVADTANHTIRKVILDDRSVTTFAGSAGSQGNTNASGAAARFDEPSGIWGDGTYLYVTERDNHAVRKIEIATGDVTLLAGDPNGSTGTDDDTGTAARFNEPRGIWGDGTYLYVGEEGNHAIRRIEIATGVVTTFAGSATTSGTDDDTGTAARFFEPTGVWGDGTHLYVTDLKNHTIRKINLATAVVTTFAGTAGLSGTTDDTGAAARFYRPEGLWGDGSNLYVMDSGNGIGRKVEISSADVTTLAGEEDTDDWLDGVGLAAHFDSPVAITGDGTHLYVADLFNNAIRLLVGTPTLTNVSPGNVTNNGTRTFTLTGTGFNPASAVTLSGLGNVTLDEVEYISPTELEITVTIGGSTGTLDIDVTNGKGTSATVSVTVQSND